jgi:hypothetical protein
LPPVVATVVHPGDQPGDIAQRLRAAFASEPQLSLTFAEGWDGSLCRAIAAVAAAPILESVSRQATSQQRWQRTDKLLWPRAAGIATAVAFLAAIVALTTGTPRLSGPEPHGQADVVAMDLQLDNGLLTGTAVGAPSPAPRAEEAFAEAPEPTGISTMPFVPAGLASADQAPGRDVPPPALDGGAGAQIGQVISSPIPQRAAASTQDPVSGPSRTPDRSRQAGVAGGGRAGRAGNENDARCRAIVTKVQLGGALTDDERSHMRNGCAPRG